MKPNTMEVIGPDGASRELRRVAEMTADDARSDPSQANERNTSWWRAVAECSTDVLIGFDRRGVISYISPSCASMFGWTAEDIIGTRGAQLIHPDDVDRLASILARSLAGDPPSAVATFRLRHGDRSWRTVEAVGSNRLDDPTIEAFIVSVRDVTDLLAAETEVLARDERYLQIIEASPEAILIHQDGAVVHTNPAALRLIGADDPLAILGIDPSTVVELDPDESSRPTTDVVSAPLPATTFDRRLYRLDRTTIPVEITSIPTIWNGNPAIQVVVRDLNDRRHSDSNLLHLATHDPLTGLPNRSLLEDRLMHATARAARTHRPFAVLFVDLDRFKVVNDTLGHEVGDELLRQVSNRLTEAVRPGDTVARLGGDEFVIVVEDLLVVDTVELVVERIQSSFDKVFEVNGREFGIGSSIGVLVTTEGGEPRSLLRDADAAMYTAKTRGRGQAVRFDVAMREQASRHEELERRLRAAIDERQLTTALQPLVRLSDRKVVGLEALMRWQHPERGLLLPEMFLDVADDAGLLSQMGIQVLDQLCARLGRWWGIHLNTPSKGPLSLNVNVTPRQLQDPAFGRNLASMLSRYGIPHRSLCIELTEDALLDDPVGMTHALRPLRQAGARLAIDDFGCGYTSLAALRRFAPDLLKIDRSFVAGMADSASDAAMVRAIIEMGHALGVMVVAEGVELMEQQHLLSVLGCDLAQGFLFGRPSDVATIERLFGLAAD